MSLSLRTPEARRIAETVKPGKTYSVEIKEYKKKRSLNQNDLYWKHLTEFARLMGMSNAEAHNRMLRMYGQPELADGNTVPVFLPDTDAAEKKALEAETYHIKPTSQVKEGFDGSMWRGYLLLRGSSTYNTQEMTRLIDGLFECCREIGIDVTSEEERAFWTRMDTTPP